MEEEKIIQEEEAPNKKEKKKVEKLNEEIAKLKADCDHWKMNTIEPTRI